MNVVGVRPSSAAAIRRAAIFATRFPCGDDVRSAEFSRTVRSRYRRLAMILARTKFTVAPRRIAIAHLGRYGLHMPPSHGCFLLRCRAGVDAALAAVIAHVGLVVNHDPLVIDVANVHDIDIRDRAVVEEVIAFPSSTGIAVAEISEAVVNATIEADLRSPETFVEQEHAAVPSPPRRSPQESNFG